MDKLALFKVRISEAEDLIEKTNKCGVLVVQQSPQKNDSIVLFPRVRESISNILIFVELSDLKFLDTLLKAADGYFYATVIDTDRKNTDSPKFMTIAKKAVKKSLLFSFSDYAVWADSAATFIAMTSGAQPGQPIYLAGEDMLAFLTSQCLLQQGFELKLPLDSKLLSTLTSANFPWRDQVAPIAKTDFGKIRIVVGAAAKQHTISDFDVELCSSQACIYDVGIGNLDATVVKRFKSKGCKIFRHDNRAGISTMVTKLLETDFLIRQIMGEAVLGKVKVVAGGILGDDGAVVVDNIGAPEYIVGVADGAGLLKAEPYSNCDREGVKFIQNLIDLGADSV